jgi:hypothetical protein
MKEFQDRHFSEPTGCGSLAKIVGTSVPLKSRTNDDAEPTATHKQESTCLIEVPNATCSEIAANASRCSTHTPTHKNGERRSILGEGNCPQATAASFVRSGMNLEPNGYGGKYY